MITGADLAALHGVSTKRLDGQEFPIVDVLRRIMDLVDPPPAPSAPAKELGFHSRGRRGPC